jgi:hypothetical protein
MPSLCILQNPSPPHPLPTSLYVDDIQESDMESMSQKAAPRQNLFKVRLKYSEPEESGGGVKKGEDAEKDPGYPSMQLFLDDDI